MIEFDKYPDSIIKLIKETSIILVNYNNKMIIIEDNY